MPGISSGTDYFLKIDGIDGESQRDKHKNEIEVLSWSFGASNAAMGDVGRGQSSAGRVSMSEFHFTKYLDKAGAKIMQTLYQGKFIPKMKMTATRLGQEGGDPVDYYIWEFEGCVIASHSLSGPASDVPTESISLRFGKVKVAYRTINERGAPGGAITAGWDNLKNDEIS